MSLSGILSRASLFEFPPAWPPLCHALSSLVGLGLPRSFRPFFFLFGLSLLFPSGFLSPTRPPLPPPEPRTFCESHRLAAVFSFLFVPAVPLLFRGTPTPRHAAPHRRWLVFSGQIDAARKSLQFVTPGISELAVAEIQVSLVPSFCVAMVVSSNDFRHEMTQRACPRGLVSGRSRLFLAPRRVKLGCQPCMRRGFCWSCAAVSRAIKTEKKIGRSRCVALAPRVMTSLEDMKQRSSFMLRGNIATNTAQLESLGPGGKCEEK